MLDEGRAENRKAMAYDGSHRDIKSEHSKPVNRGAWDVLKRMMAHRCRHVDIGIGMVQRMKAPKERHCVLAPMNEVTNEVEQQKGRNQAQPGIADRPGWQGEARQRLDPRPDESRRGEDISRENQIHDPEPDIRDPAPQGGKLAPSPRPREFPQGYHQQAAED